MKDRDKMPNSRFELEQFLKFNRHDITAEEQGPNIFVVHCSCGYEVPAPWGEQHAARIIENHMNRVGLAPSPMGSRYRA